MEWNGGETFFFVCDRSLDSRTCLLKKGKNGIVMQSYEQVGLGGRLWMSEAELVAMVG